MPKLVLGGWAKRRGPRYERDRLDEFRSCERKKPWPTFAIAAAKAEELNAEPDCWNPSQHAYRCRHCGQYHVGRLPSVRRPRMRQLRERLSVEEFYALDTRVMGCLMEESGRRGRGRALTAIQRRAAGAADRARALVS